MRNHTLSFSITWECDRSAGPVKHGGTLSMTPNLGLKLGRSCSASREPHSFSSEVESTTSSSSSLLVVTSTAMASQESLPPPRVTAFLLLKSMAITSVQLLPHSCASRKGRSR